MKFRTDFVTNSSSSCFCVTLTLQFDNDKKKTLRLSNVEPEGDEGYFDNCGRSNYGGLGSYDYMQNFARLLSCRDDKEKLFSALQYMCDGKGKKYAYGVWDGDQLTKAEMRINGCASGEYMSYTRVTRLLGIYDRNGEYGSVEEAVDALKKKGYTVYTDNALETIVLYDDADTRQQFREEGKIRGIRYGANNLSKQITAKMNKEGKIDIEIAYGEQYSPRYNEYNLAPAMEIDNIRYNELKLKALDFQLQKVRMKKAALQEKMRGG